MDRQYKVRMPDVDRGFECFIPLVCTNLDDWEGLQVRWQAPLEQILAGSDPSEACVCYVASDDVQDVLKVAARNAFRPATKVVLQKLVKHLRLGVASSASLFVHLTALISSSHSSHTPACLGPAIRCALSTFVVIVVCSSFVARCCSQVSQCHL